jgi:alpha-L-rhamnosidase
VLPCRRGTRADGRFRLEARVPVGTTAQVWLPGTDAHETVAHGEHRWEVPDPFPPSPEPRTPVTVRDVLDEPATWSAVAAAAVRTGVAPGGEVEAARRLAAHLDTPATGLARAFDPQEFSPGAGAFQHEVDAIFGSLPD